VGPSYPALKLTLPNIEYALGFLNKYNNPAGSPYLRESLNQSGVHVRIYRRRLSAEYALGKGTPIGSYDPVTGVHEPILGKLDIPDAFLLLAEFRIDATNKGVFYDNGELIPDMNRRLRDTHGYQTFGCYPHPDKRYVFDIRCIRRPQKLESDRDVPLIHAEATNVLIQRSMMLLYENMGNAALSQLSFQRYQEQLITLSKRYGDLRPPQTPVQRRPARANPMYRGRSNYRKWWSTSS
jgi:hypothetical protein